MNKMNIDVKVTILLDEAGLRIQLTDANSGVRFCNVKLHPKAACAAMGRLSQTPGKAEIYGLENVGKYLIFETLIFEMPEHDEYDCGEDTREIAAREAERLCPEGWTPDKSFNSQDTFWKDGDKRMAKTTIRSYVGKKEHTKWKKKREQS